jgi:pilus assembly protein CpaC
MHRTPLQRRIAAGLAATGLLAGAAAAQQPPAPPAPPEAKQPAPGQPPAPPPIGEAKVDRITGALLVPFGGTVRYTPPSGRLIVDVFLKNEDTVQARLDPLNPKTLVLTGIAPGLTELTLTFDDRTRATLPVSVEIDYAQVEIVIRRAVPTASVKIIPGVGRVIVLSGYVTRPEDSDTVARIASAAVGGNLNNVVNALQIGGDTHVLIDTVIAQVDRTELRQRGTSWAVQGSQFGISNILGGIGNSTAIGTFNSGFGAIAPGFFTQGNAISNTNLLDSNIKFGIVPAGFLGALRALSTEGVAKFLSEPKVITQTGRPARLRAGGQQATLGATNGFGGPGIERIEVGTTVEVLPIVLGTGKIYLEVRPEVRSVNFGRGITTGFGTTPGFNETTIQSCVLLESGQTYAIGGLIESQVQNTAGRVPYLGSLPFIGTAFSDVRAEERETELVILVTPRLVDALDCSQLPRRVPGRESRSPDDYELFLEGLIEAPRGQRRVWNGHQYVPAWRNDPTACNYPCVGPTGPAACGPTGCAPAGGGVVAAPAAAPGTVVIQSGGAAPADPAPAAPPPQ